MVEKQVRNLCGLSALLTPHGSLLPRASVFRYKTHTFPRIPAACTFVASAQLSGLGLSCRLTRHERLTCFPSVRSGGLPRLSPDSAPRRTPLPSAARFPLRGRLRDSRPVRCASYQAHYQGVAWRYLPRSGLGHRTHEPKGPRPSHMGFWSWHQWGQTARSAHVYVAHLYTRS